MLSACEFLSGCQHPFHPGQTCGPILGSLGGDRSHKPRADSGEQRDQIYVPAEAQHGIRNTLASDTRDSPTLHCLHRNPISKHHPQLEVTLAVCWLQTNAPEHLLRDPSPLPCALPRPIPSHCWQVYGRRKLSLLLSTPESLSRGCLQRWAVTHIVSEARLNQEKQVG